MPSAAILAGGRARRFDGCDKSALRVDGRSILDRQVAELARLTDDILLVGRDERRPGWSPPGSRGTHIRMVPDRVPGCGPLGGLDAALAAARDETLVVVACDMPFVTAELLAHLAALATEADAVVPRTERGYHPLCAAYTRACQTPVAHRLEDGRLAMNSLLEDVRVRIVTGRELDAFGDRRRLLANVNTAAQYAELVRFSQAPRP